MNNEERRARFEIVRKPRRVATDREEFVEPASQGLLFPIPRRDLLIFIVFPLVTEDDFVRTLELSRPVTILELRRSPRFDIGQLNRHQAFRWFEANQSKYYDLPSALPSEEKYGIDPVQLVGNFLSRAGNQLSGPVMILISQGSLECDSNDSDVFTRITKLFASVSNHTWQTIEVPKFA